MNDMFKPNSPAIRFLTRLCDLILLNLMFLISFCTVILSGSAVTALYAQALRMVRREEESIVKGYWLAVRDNFLSSFPATLLLFVDILLLAVIGYALGAEALVFPPTGLMLLCLLAILLTAFLSWLFPLIARFENNFPGHCRNALRLALSHLPVTFLMTLIHLLPMLSLYGFSAAIGYLLGFWFFIGIAAGAWVNAWYLRRCFDSLNNVRK